MSETPFVFEAIGVYRWPFTPSDVRALCKDAWGDRSSEHMRLSREQLEGLVLIELLVRSGAGTLDVGDICQRSLDQRDDSSQVPYDESFWSADGTKYLDHYHPPSSTPYRVVFFLHYFVPEKPLLWSDDTMIPLPAPTKLPDRLSIRITTYDRP